MEESYYTLEKVNESLHYTDENNCLSIWNHDFNSGKGTVSLVICNKAKSSIALTIFDSKHLDKLVSVIRKLDNKKEVMIQTPTETFVVTNIPAAGSGITTIEISKLIISSSGKSRNSLCIKLACNEINELHNLLIRCTGMRTDKKMVTMVRNKKKK